MLVVLPCAGGCAMNYSRYERDVDDTIVYEYPGHWSKYDEPLILTAEALADKITLDILKWCENTTNNFYILGHSMGGLLAWTVASKLICQGANVDGVIIAASAPKGTGIGLFYEIRDDDGIKEFLKKIRQISEKVLCSDFFNEELLPIIRTDFNIVRELLMSYEKENKKIDIPITCLYGTEDPLVDKTEMVYWRQYTNGNVKLVECEGDHFFVSEENCVKIVCNEIGS